MKMRPHDPPPPSDAANKEASKRAFSPLVHVGFLFLALIFFLTALYLKDKESSDIFEKYDELRLNVAALSVLETDTIDEVTPEEGQPVPLRVKATVATTKPQPPLSPDTVTVRKGILYLDREGGNHVITIGREHGIQEGHRLNIYENGRVIGQVRVITPLEKISLVTLENTSLSNLPRDYYEVSFE